ncbi:MAG: serine/threonine-protein kinase [Polyangiaceae bacterium]
MSRGGIVSPFLAGAVIARRYRLLRLAGAGAAGFVWRAKDERTGDDVALKLLVRPDLELRARLLREASALCALRHENVVSVRDAGETGSGDPFLISDLIEADTLAVELSRRGKLTQQEAARIGRDVARALFAAHSEGLVHRDLKPSNVFLIPGEEGTPPRVKVGDFGLGESVVPVALPRGDGASTSGVTVYLSPEQALSETFIDGRSDVWSLGALLFEMLSGSPLFTGEEEEVLSRVVSGPIPLLWHRVRNVHPGLSGLVMACLRRDRDERPFPISEVARRLDHFATPPRTSSFPPPSPPRRPSERVAPPPIPPPKRLVIATEAARAEERAPESPPPIAFRRDALMPEMIPPAPTSIPAANESARTAFQDTESALFATLPSARSPYSRPEETPRRGPDSGVVPIRGLRALVPRVTPPAKVPRGAIAAALIAALLALAAFVYAAAISDDEPRPTPGLDVPRF